MKMQCGGARETNDSFFWPYLYFFKANLLKLMLHLNG